MKIYTVELARPSTQVVRVEVPDDATWEDVKNAVLDAHIPYQWTPRNDGYTFILQKEEVKDQTTRTRDYEMYTPEGNQALAAAVDHLIQSAESGQFDRPELPDQVAKMLDLVSAMGHDECHDTEPEWAVTDEINERLCGPKMWQALSREDF